MDERILTPENCAHLPVRFMFAFGDNALDVTHIIHPGRYWAIAMFQLNLILQEEGESCGQVWQTCANHFPKLVIEVKQDGHRCRDESRPGQEL